VATTTRSRPPRGREQARQASGGVAAEHAGKIYSVAIGGAVVILAFLTLTSPGHVIDAAVQHFMLFYAGVFALIALCASVGLGFVATDRMVLGPGHRVFLQSAHRAASFGAVAFLIVHIVTEILAQRVHVLDAFIPFLSPFRTFYIGLGTIASDFIILLVITSIFRKRFTATHNAWKWRAIHYTSYAAFVFGVWHGLLGGRPGKPYVDWSYGFVVAFVALGLGVRILANSLRPKENLSSAPVPEAGGNSGSAPMRAVSMFA
jgi:DMSO/TMAO reductase YedYZ heme-binding membrane subunit